MGLPHCIDIAFWPEENEEYRNRVSRAEVRTCNGPTTLTSSEYWASRRTQERRVTQASARSPAVGGLFIFYLALLDKIVQRRSADRGVLLLHHLLFEFVGGGSGVKDLHAVFHDFGLS